MNEIRGVSPVKLSPKARESYIKNTKKNPLRVDDIPNLNINFTQQEFNHLRELTADLRSIELMKMITRKGFQSLDKQSYYENANGNTKKCFDALEEDLFKSLDAIRKERVENVLISNHKAFNGRRRVCQAGPGCLLTFQAKTYQLYAYRAEGEVRQA